MGQRYSEITDELRRFIEAQKVFFVATATGDSRINLSPKGMDYPAVAEGHGFAAGPGEKQTGLAESDRKR